MTSKKFTLPFPPSVNTYWRRSGFRIHVSQKGTQFRKDALELIGNIKDKLLSPLTVTLDLYPPCRRKRDVDNYAKGVLDALTHAGVWDDDSQVQRLTIQKYPKDGDPRVEVTIEEYVVVPA